MGISPTKSQNLHELYPHYKFLPQLTSNISNQYEFIFVGKGPDVYIIKQLSFPHNNIKNENIVRLIETKQLQNSYYGLYEWMPHSVENIFQANPHLLNREKAFTLIETCVKVYTYLWKTDKKQFIDIKSQNIKGILKENNVIVKIVPPSLTQTNNNKLIYKNKISDLGLVLRQILIGKNQYLQCYIEKKYGKDVQQYVSMLIGTKVSSINEWERVQLQLNTLQQPKRLQYVYDNHELNHNYSRMQVSQVSQVSNISHLSQVSQVSSNTPKNNNAVNINNYSTLQHNRKSTSPINEKRSSFSPIQQVNNFNINKYTSQYPQPVSHHQNFYVPRSPNVSKSPINRTQSKIRFNTNENSDHNKSYQSYREVHSNSNMGINVNASPRIVRRQVSPKKCQIPVTSRILSHRNVSPSNFASQNPNNKINNPKVLVFQRAIEIPGMFQPSSKDQMAVNWKSGVPSPHYTQKMKEDKNYIYEQDIQEEEVFPVQIKTHKKKNTSAFTNSNSERSNSNRLMQNLLINKKKKEESLLQQQSKEKEQILIKLPKQRSSKVQFNEVGRIQNQKQIFISERSEKKSQKENYHQTHNQVQSQRHLIKEEKQRQRQKEVQSSFGLQISQDEEFDYNGVYEGSYHPQYPKVKHGQGKMVFPSGGTYVGSFNNNKMDGWGKLFYPSGRLAYEGYWKGGRFDGYGKLFNETPLHIQIFDYSDFNRIQLPNEQGYWKVYQGNMRNDMKQGQGIWILQNGEKYEGQFKLDTVDGQGTFYGKKETIHGKWRDNILISIFQRQ